MSSGNSNTGRNRVPMCKQAKTLAESIEREKLSAMQGTLAWHDTDALCFQAMLDNAQKAYEAEVTKIHEGAKAAGHHVIDNVIVSGGLGVVRARHPGVLPDDDALALAVLRSQ